VQHEIFWLNKEEPEICPSDQEKAKEMVCMKLDGGYTPFTKDEWGRQVAG
jgi:hypothetical protein